MAADSRSSVGEAPPLTAQPGAKIRKIRKGTRSCWECKRRKNKCTWADGEGKCNDCHRRGTRCIGQEFPQEQAAHEKRGTNKSDDNRLQRLEKLVEELSRNINPEDARGHHTQSRPNDRGDKPSIGTSDGRRKAVLSSKLPAANDIALQPRLIRAPAGSSLGQFGQATGEQITPVVHALVAAWPSEHHHDAILSSNVGPLHPALSAACSGFQTPPSPKDLLQLPPPGTTPVAIARKLLILGTYLQVLSSQSDGEITGPNPEFLVVSSRAIEIVGKLITHNDNLPQSVEIIECLVIETQYHNYMGNIRRAWIVLRRAIAIAQVLGLDRQSKSLAHNTNTVEAQATSHQESVWFLLVRFDQYISLMLGASPTLPENSQIPPGLLERYTPSERMGRLHSLAAGRILQRNRINIYDIIELREIDKILQTAAACMPAQWWLPPDWSNDCGGEGFLCIVSRLMVHFAHYNILLQLHLPYMLHSLSNQKFYYSTTTVISASREILARFTTFRSRHPTVSYCRGLDFFTFVASIALCLLHIHASYENQILGHCDSISISDLLAHQRVANRGLMERALQSIEKIAQIESDDKLISDIIPAFRKLLAVEEESYKGVSYSIHLPPNAEQLKHNSDDTLYLDLPFCGTIRVERANVSNTPLTETSVSEKTTQMTHILMGSFPSSSEGCFMTTFPILSAPEHECATIIRGYHVDKHQPDVTNTYNIIPRPSSLQPMSYNDNDETQDCALASELRSAILLERALPCHTSRFAARFKVGNELDEGTVVGPISNRPQYERVKDLLANIEESKLNVLPRDGQSIEGLNGFFIRPIVVSNLPDDAMVMVEEAFGPIIPVMK
ncbi:hypothetical protein E0Z10_g7683 [Xylaria hypoxylon]|uniref:Zn(2)-C6 fungal-type domain-containing protein n=1 Tax=Xylaria hypoxylon TaxID=37992 RepID=A0A4Z0YQ19_9PEZI|nr:hypothetical protein E0Z10_g7683 [Xylaria hypoxylon]